MTNMEEENHGTCRCFPLNMMWKVAVVEESKFDVLSDFSLINYFIQLIRHKISSFNN